MLLRLQSGVAKNDVHQSTKTAPPPAVAALAGHLAPALAARARAAVAASKARSALAPTQTSNDDAASVDKRQPDAFKAFLDVAADLPEAAPPVSKPQTRGELKRFQRARLAWEAARPEREAARLRREEIKRETEAVARKLVEARKELERTIAETPEPPPSVDEVYAQVQARRQAAEAAVEASSPPSKLPFGSPAPAPAPKPAAFGFGSPAAAPAPAAAKSSYPPMPSKPPSKLPFGSPAAAKPASSGYPPMPSKAPSKLPFGAPAPAPAAKPATFGFAPAAAPAPAKPTFGFAPAAAPKPAPAAFGGFAARRGADLRLGLKARRPTRPAGSASKLGAAPAFGSPSALGATPTFGSASKLGATPTFGAKTPEKEDHRAKLVEFYQKHNPGKLDTVDATLKKYAGREHELWAQLKKKYAVQAPEAEGTGPRCFWSSRRTARSSAN